MISAVMKTTGVYCWLNKVNGKVYVGSASISFRKRFNEYDRTLPLGTCRNRYLQRSWDKHGADNFKRRILEICSPEKCIEREQHWIDYYDSANPAKGYNLCPKAGSVLGLKHSDESKKRHSARSTRQFSTEEGRQKARDAANRRWSRQEERDKVRMDLTGKKHSPEECQRQSERGKKRYENPEERRKSSEIAKKQWANPVMRIRRLISSWVKKRNRLVVQSKLTIE